MKYFDRAALFAILYCSHNHQYSLLFHCNLSTSGLVSSSIFSSIFLVSYRALQSPAVVRYHSVSLSMTVLTTSHSTQFCNISIWYLVSYVTNICNLLRSRLTVLLFSVVSSWQLIWSFGISSNSVVELLMVSPSLLILFLSYSLFIPVPSVLHSLSLFDALKLMIKRRISCANFLDYLYILAKQFLLNFI